MNKRQANTVMALVLVLIVTQILCTALILNGQARLRAALETQASQASTALDVEKSNITSDISGASALLVAREQAATYERQIDELQLQIAQAEKQTEDLQSQSELTRIESNQDKAKMEAERLDENLQRLLIKEQTSAINRALSEQNSRLSGLIPIPLAK